MATPNPLIVHHITIIPKWFNSLFDSSGTLFSSTSVSYLCALLSYPLALTGETSSTSTSFAWPLYSFSNANDTTELHLKLKDWTLNSFYKLFTTCQDSLFVAHCHFWRHLGCSVTFGGDNDFLIESVTFGGNNDIPFIWDQGKGSDDTGGRRNLLKTPVLHYKPQKSSETFPKFTIFEGKMLMLASLIWEKNPHGWGH